MGYIRHNAIVVTSWSAAAIDAAASRAREIGLTVLGPSESVVNGYRTLLVCPDGSKEGWEDSNLGDKRRDAFSSWLYSHRHSDESSPFEWVEIHYGSDDGLANVERHAWSKNMGHSNE